jgi:hypothetical protein
VGVRSLHNQIEKKGEDNALCSTMEHKCAKYPEEEAKIYFYNAPLSVHYLIKNNRIQD